MGTFFTVGLTGAFFAEAVGLLADLTVAGFFTGVDFADDTLAVVVLVVFLAAVGFAFGFTTGFAGAFTGLAGFAAGLAVGLFYPII